MRFKNFPWLAAAALLVVSSIPGWAQPELVGGEFKVNQNRMSRQLQPVIAFNPAGQSLIVWENDVRGILGRFYDRNGAPLSGELTLVASQQVQIPSMGEVMVRKEPALVYLPNGEFLLFWTEEKDYLSVDHFYENRRVLEQSVRGQLFSATGKPLAASFQVNETATGFDRRPKATLQAGRVVVIWEGDTNFRDSRSIHGRFVARRGQALGGEFRIDSGNAVEIQNLALAANPSGETLVVWEADLATGPEILGRIFDRDGAPIGAEARINAETAGRQRRPAALATRNGDFLVSWQTYLRGTPAHGIVGQLLSSAGAKIGSELQISRGIGEVQISPALALLPSGNIVVAWMDWIETLPIGAFAVLLDEDGNRLGDEIKISTERLFPQYQLSLAANAHGEILAAWEGRVRHSQAITARLMKAD